MRSIDQKLQPLKKLEFPNCFYLIASHCIGIFSGQITQSGTISKLTLYRQVTNWGAHRHLARLCKIFDAREARQNKFSCTPCNFFLAPPVIFFFLDPLIYFNGTPVIFLDPDIFRTTLNQKDYIKSLSLIFYVLISDFSDTYSINITKPKILVLVP